MWNRDELVEAIPGNGVGKRQQIVHGIKKNMGYFKALVHGVDTWAGKHTIVSVIGFCISFLFCSIMFPMVYYWLILSYTVWMVNSTMLKTHVSPYIDLFIIMLLHNKINGIKGFYCNKYSSSNFFADLYVICYH